MRFRVFLGRSLVRLGRFVQSLALVVMRPDDLVEFNRQFYAKPRSIADWNAHALTDSDLNPDEKALLDKVPVKSGQMLLLGLGGGREAIFLGKNGFQITGIDFIPVMVEHTRQNAARCGIEIEGLIQEISKLEVPPDTFDVIWLSAAMYSSIPTRHRRNEMLKRIGGALKPNGYFVCQFFWTTSGKFSSKIELARKVFAYLTLGNLWYEKGDMLWANQEFIHAFSKEDELMAEFDAAGFEKVYMHFEKDILRGGAVLKLRS